MLILELKEEGMAFKAVSKLKLTELVRPEHAGVGGEVALEWLLDFWLWWWIESGGAWSQHME